MGDHSRTMRDCVTDGAPQPPDGGDGLDITIKIKIQPRGKGRPRTTFRGAKPSTYTPRTTVEYQRELWATIGPQLPDKIEGPIRIDAVFFLKRPKSKMGRKWSDAAYAPVKPDLDNCCKALWDSCALAFGDQQVVATSMMKLYSTKAGEPQILMRIRRPVADITHEIHRIMFSDV